MDNLDIFIKTLEVSSELADENANRTENPYDIEVSNCLKQTLIMFKTGNFNIDTIGKITEKLSHAYWKER